jgi:hypothetical protein
MRDIVYIVGIFVAASLGFFVGKTEGINQMVLAIPKPVEVNLENQCIAWFFNADLKAAKKHMCGNKK